MPNIWRAYRGTSGVYQIRNLVTGKVYVGSAVCIWNRYKAHFNGLKAGRHHSKHLQRSWQKYGSKAFRFSLLERCPPEQLIEREQYWLDHLQAADPKHGYNRRLVADSALGLKMPEGAKQRIGEAAKKQWAQPGHREKVAAKIAATLTGRKLSAETLAKRTAKQRPLLVARNRSLEHREKVSKSLMGHPVSAETRAKLSQANRGKYSALTEEQVIEARRLRRKYGRRWSLPKLAARYGCDPGTVRRALTGQSWGHLTQEPPLC